MAEGTPLQIDPLSVTSLYLKVNVNGILLANATGFAVEEGGNVYLVTNWHVLSGRHPETGDPISKKTAGIPDEIRVAHHLRGSLGTWRFHGETLNNSDGSPRWIGHPAGSDIDVAAVRLRNLPSDVRIFPLDLSLAETDLLLHAGMPVSVIGFPFGLRPNAFFGVWKTGHIASDPDLPYNGRPAFLIDATTREGMSGSPVVARSYGGRMTSQGYTIGGVHTRLLGIYSSRIHDDAEIGCVWRPSTIRELLQHAAGR
jgi:hypothetical protein